MRIQAGILSSMNDDFFKYKTRFLTISLLISYTYIHLKLTGLFTETTLEQYLDFSVRLPFGQRLLIPAIARCIAFLFPLSADEIFFLLEALFVCLLYFSLKKMMSYEFSTRPAQLLSWLFLLLLPLITVINYRYASTGVAAIYFPSDTATLFFMVMGYYFCLQEKWIRFTLWVFVASFNRESSFLLLLMIPALHWQRLREIIKPLGLAILAWLLARLLILWCIQDLPGQLLELNFFSTSYTRFEVNLLRLFQGQQIFFFLFCLVALPLAWFAFSDYIPRRYYPIRYVALLYFLCLLLVGNFIEARIFGEIVVLLYLPVCVALKRWLMDERPQTFPERSSLLFYLDRYAVLGFLFLVIMLQNPLNQLVSYLMRHLLFKG